MFKTSKHAPSHARGSQCTLSDSEHSFPAADPEATCEMGLCSLHPVPQAVRTARTRGQPPEVSSCEPVTASCPPVIQTFRGVVCVRAVSGTHVPGCHCPIVTAKGGSRLVSSESWPQPARGPRRGSSSRWKDGGGVCAPAGPSAPCCSAGTTKHGAACCVLSTPCVKAGRPVHAETTSDRSLRPSVSWGQRPRNNLFFPLPASTTH